MILKSIVVVIAIILSISIFFHSFLFNILGLTTFCLPPFLILTLFLNNEKVKKYLKLSLFLWIPVLINLALVRDLLEIKANIGGIAGLIFTFAHNNKIDFIFIFFPILAMDLLILYLLGVNIPGFFRRIVDEIKSLFGNKK
ncbi:hypothetical protein ACFLRT_00060 [Acidobacteriota bacterium]